MFHQILVPLDGSVLATRVLPHVLALAQALGSNLTLLRVLEGEAALDGVMPTNWQLHKAEAHAYLRPTTTKRNSCLSMCWPNRR